MALKVRQITDLRAPGQPLAGLSDFAKEHGDAAFCRRLLKKYDADVQKCSEKYMQALRWIEANQDLLASRRFAHAWDNRVVGADSQRQPIVYMCMKNQMLPGAQGADQLLVGALQAIDNMPPGVESASHIWDMHGMVKRWNLNPAALAQRLQAAESYFAGRVRELVVVDLPRVATFLKDAAWPLVPERTRQKVRFLTAEDAKLHFKHRCPAEDASRIASIIDQNRDARLSLEERRASWTRVDARGALVPAFA